MPENCDLLWRSFQALANRRHYTDWGSPLAIPYTEILAWMTLTRTPLQPYEIELLLALDNAVCSEIIAQAERDAPASGEDDEED